MPFDRFKMLIDDFDKRPPVFEVLRTQILMPGDKGYPKADPNRVATAMRETIKPAGKEPEWMRNARLKRERLKDEVPHAR